MTHPERRAVTRDPSALASAALTIYVTLLLLGLAVPGSVVSALQDAPRSAVTQRALEAAEQVEGVMDRTGLPAAFQSLRERFREISCGGPASANPC